MASIRAACAAAGAKVFRSPGGFAETVAVNGGEVLATVIRHGPQAVHDETETSLRSWVDVEVAVADVAAFELGDVATVDGKDYAFERALYGPDDFGQHAARFERAETDQEKHQPGYRARS